MKLSKAVIRLLLRHLLINPMLTISVFSLIVPVTLIHCAIQLAVLPGGLIVVISTVASTLVFTSWLVCQFRPTC